MVSSARFKTIVVGIDFSKLSRAALRQAILLQEMMDCKLVLAHVAFLPDNIEEIVNDKWKGEMGKQVAKEIHSFYRLPKDVSFELKLALGNPAQELIEIAKQSVTPLILVGASGRNLVSRMLLGSTAEQLAVTSPCPVWIHKTTTAVSPKKVLATVDLSKSSEALVRWTQMFAQNYDLKVEGLFVSRPLVPVLDIEAYAGFLDEAEMITARKFKAFRASRKNVPIIKRIGDPVEEIIRAGKKSDLIVMTPHNRPKHFPTLGSVCAKVARKSKTPILIIPA